MFDDLQRELSYLWKAPITLTKMDDNLSTQYEVWRCQVTGDNSPPTVIVKHWQPVGEKSPYQAAVTPARFQHEQLSLELLTTLSVPVAPKVLFSAENILVLQDLGVLPTVADIVFEEGNPQAEDAMIQMGRAMGRLHASTYNKKHLLTGAMPPSEADAAIDTSQRIETLQAAFEAFNLELSTDTITGIQTLENRIQTEFQVLAHCDPGLHNMLYSTDGVYILDFEFAQFTHGFIDLACVRLGYPVSFRAHRTPAALVERIEQAYREEIISTIPDAADGDWFAQALSDACLHWSLVWITNGWRHYLQKRITEGEAFDNTNGRTPEIMGLMRSKMYTIASAASSLGDSPLHKAVASWKNALKDHFDDVELLSYFPAFQRKEPS